ncbi:MAG TPA: glycoside hydrolase domain-containing protein, partial [Kofleriaceae bacterium]
HRDANVAFGALTNIKAPTHAACYFTADFDPKGNQIEHDLDLVEAYFQGVKEGAGGDTSRIGVYGTYLSIQRLYKKGLITYAWQMVFDGKGDAIDPRVNIYQYDIWQHDTMTAFGVAGAGAVDLDCAVTPTDYGAFGV